MALTKVTRSGITDNSVNAAKIEDGTIVDADITPGTITTAKLASTLDLSSKTVTLPNTSVTNGQLAGSIANAKLANSSITVNGSAIALGGSVSAGALDWQSVITGDTTMVAGRGYFVNTSGGAITMTLPAGGTAGDTIAIKDYAGTFGSNKVTIARNGHNIQGVANNSQLATARAAVVLVYIDATKGWLYTNESNVADLQQALHIGATGGTVVTTGDFKVHVFTGDGNFVVANTGNKPSVPTGGPNTVDYLVVAGGGGGSISGGGGGGYRTSYPSPNSCAGVIAVTAQTYPITVGAGGGTGSNSIFSTITSAGGGVGRHYVHPDGIGEPGGSGSGGARAPGTADGGNGNDPPVSPPQGNNGGPSGPSSQITGGGGGGAGQGGATGPGTGGNGAPIATAFFGPTSGSYGTPGPSSGRYFAGGGGGSLHQPGESSKSGGAGGGGTGYPGGAPAPGDGGTNTGGGAGGATQPGGQTKSGGKGIVVVRYKFQN